MQYLPQTLPFDLGASKKAEIVAGSDTWDSDIILAGTSTRVFSLRRHDSGIDWTLIPESGAQVLLNNSPANPAGTIVSNGDCIQTGDWTLQFWDGVVESIPEGMFEGFAVRVKNLSDARDGKVILDKIEFTAEGGEFVGILGPSGCGKSSLIQRIAGLAKWSEGSIDLGEDSTGQPIAVAGHEAQIAYVPQEAHKGLHEELSVWQELDCHMRIRSKASATDDVRKSGALAVFGLSGERNKRVGDLSGGQQRRLAIALAILQRPRLLLLDEPTSGLDPAAEAALMGYLAKLSKQGCTIICSTHMLANLDRFSRVLVLDTKGAQVDFTEPSKLLGSCQGNLLGLYGKLSSARRMEAATAHTSFRQRLTNRLLSARKQVGIFAKGLWSTCDASRFRTILGYTLRQIHEHTAPMRRAFVSDWDAGTDESAFSITRKLAQSAWAGRSTIWLFAGLPLLMAFAIRYGLREKFTGLFSDYTVVTFCSCLAAFWMGMSHAVRMLVGERIPGRCLERLDGVGTFRYVTAKFAWCVVAAIIQSTFFLFPFIFWKTYASDAGITAIYEPSGFVIHLLVLSAVHFMGGCVGLSISAMSRKETTALTWVPLVGMLVLLFSTPVLHPGKYAENEPAKSIPMRICRKLMPCNPAEVILDRQCEELDVGTLKPAPNGGNTKPPYDKKSWPIFFTRLGSYFLLGFLATTLFQRLNESEWEGR